MILVVNIVVGGLETNGSEYLTVGVSYQHVELFLVYVGENYDALVRIDCPDILPQIKKVCSHWTCRRIDCLSRAGRILSFYE